MGRAAYPWYVSPLAITVKRLRYRDSRLATYMALAYVFSWLLWGTVVLLFPDVRKPPSWALLLAMVGVYGPSIAAVATAAIHGGRPELRSLLARLWRWRVAWWWYVLVLFGPPSFVWLGAGIHKLLGGVVGVSGIGSVLGAAVILATFIPFGPLGEELGWRGYALPRLEGHFSPLASSVMLGLIWAAWHLPMFWFTPVGLPTRSLSTVGTWAANVLSFSILLSYAARRTNYSVPIAVLLHATLNAGAAMGFAVLVASSWDAEGIRSWAQVVLWLIVLSTGIALARERNSRAFVPAEPLSMA